MCGVMLGDGSLRMNGSNALLSIQQTHPEITQGLWNICHRYHLVVNPVKRLYPSGKRPVHYFQSLTMPYFTDLYNYWYVTRNGLTYKIIPSDLGKWLTPLALAHWIMGDGGFDGFGRGLGRVSLYANNFTLKEVELLQSILLTQYGISSGLKRNKHSDPNRGYVIRIPARHLSTLRELCAPHMYPSLLYKLGLPMPSTNTEIS